MKWLEKWRPATGSRAGWTIELFSFLFSYTAAPVAIAVLSVLVLFNPVSRQDVPHSEPVGFRVLADPTGRFDIDEAALALQESPVVTRYDTRLSEKPLWIQVRLAPQTDEADGDAAPPGAALQFPSRHVQRLACYDGVTHTSLGRVSREHPLSGDLSRSGAGVALTLGVRTDVICRAVFSGPALVGVVQLPADAVKDINDTFFRRAGLLEGGLATLAVFVLITALINRDWVYVLFAAWLFGNLRLGAISMGWDEMWLGTPLPLEWVSLIRKITVPVYYILTCTLFATLFRNDLPRVGFQWLFRAVLWLGPVLLVASVALPVPMYLPLMWAIASFAIVVLVFMLARLAFVAPSRSVMWYGAALGVTLVASFSEVASAALKVRFFIPGLNSVTAALISSLMAALAIAEQIRAERLERMRAQAELNHAYAASPVGLFTLNPDGSFARMNPALEAMLGMHPGDTRRHWDDFFAPGSWRPIYREALASGAVEVELMRDATVEAAENDGAAEGDVSPLSSRTNDDAPLDATPELTPAAADESPQRHFLVRAAHARMQLEGSVQDVTERQQAVHTLQFLAEHDPLTGALNRRGIDRQIHEMLARVAPGEATLVIAYLDLDRFKLINDLFGHHIGDEVLKQVRRRMESVLRPTDRVCRIGGDEFVVLFTATPIDFAARAAQRIVDRIDADPYQIGRRAFHVRASVGIIESPPGLRAEEAISSADMACREAKSNGNGRVVVYRSNAPMFKERARELSLIETFSGDLPTQGLFLEMQPIMSLKTPWDALDFEVLLRMRGADGSVIPPARAIAAAEANGTISALDRWVMETTLAWIDTHRAQLPHTRFVSVNVSGASLNDEHFVSALGELFERYRHVVPLLCIEITEGVALHDLANTRRLIGNVQRLGAKVALDDFGAGYTSFPYLRDLPADALKIDGCFVREIHSLSANAAIVEAAIGLARNLGMQSIAEWVEDAATLDVLQSMRVDYVQGFAIARPQAPETILAARSAADFVKDPAILELIGLRRELLDERADEDEDDYTPRSLH